MPNDNIETNWDLSCRDDIEDNDDLHEPDEIDGLDNADDLPFNYGDDLDGFEDTDFDDWIKKLEKSRFFLL